MMATVWYSRWTTVTCISIESISTRCSCTPRSKIYNLNLIIRAHLVSKQSVRRNILVKLTFYCSSINGTRRTRGTMKFWCTIKYRILNFTKSWQLLFGWWCEKTVQFVGNSFGFFTTHNKKYVLVDKQKHEQTNKYSELICLFY